MADDAAGPSPEGEASGSVVPFPLAPGLGRQARHNLPVQLTSFVGRGREIDEIGGLLAGPDTRLLTLTGPGGSGKTRLAVATELVEGFEGGAGWVGLAALSEPALVPQAVARALGVSESPGRSPTQALMEHLTSKETLLVLDNCEHLVDACATLADALLRACPDLRIFATSREALNVAGEVAWPVPPFSLPDPRRLPAIESL